MGIGEMRKWGDEQKILGEPTVKPINS
jgi:hypothetical protein